MHFLYIDPGAGAMAAQVIAAMAGGFILFKNRLINWFKSVFNKRKSKGG